MRVFCPNCSEPINISDELAGKTTNCPLCKAAFTAPTLFSSAPPTPGPATIGAAPPSSAPLPASNSPGPLAAAPAPATSFTAAPPGPPTRIPFTPSLDLSAGGTPSGYARSFGCSVSPEIVQWTAPVCLVLCVFLTLFSWNGAFPGGHGVYTQGPWRALVGSMSVDNVGEQVLRLNTAPAEGQVRLRDQISPNYLMLLYLPLLLGTTALAVFFTLLPQLPVKVPANLQQYLHWRMLAVALLALLVTFLLLIQALRGFGLENALVKRARAEVSEPLPENPTNDQTVAYEIREGLALDKYNVHQTTALELVFILQILAVLGALGAYFMTQRTDRPRPRFEVMW